MSIASVSPRSRSAHAEDSGFAARAGFEPFQPGDLEQSIPGRFQAVALRRGDATAIVDERGAVSYRELLGRARGIGAALVQMLDDRSGPVAVHLPIAPAVEALLGVLFCGRPY